MNGIDQAQTSAPKTPTRAQWQGSCSHTSSFPYSLTYSFPHTTFTHSVNSLIHHGSLSSARSPDPFWMHRLRLCGDFLATGPGGQEPRPWGVGSFHLHQPAPSWCFTSCQRDPCYKAINSRPGPGVRRGTRSLWVSMSSLA